MRRLVKGLVFWILVAIAAIVSSPVAAAQSPVKLEQQYRYVNNVTTLVAPDDPFPMYFFGYLQKQANGFIDPELIARLENCLKGSEYWRQQFNAFELSPDHLKTGVFPEALKKQSKVA